MRVFMAELLTPEECDAFVAMFPVREAGKVNSEREEIRSSRIAFVPPEVVGLGRELVWRIKNALFSVNASHYKFDITRTEPLQLAEYETGSFYGPHLDLGPGAASLRKLSASIQLTDPGEYDGGDLKIWNSGTAERGRGMICIFPSYLIHEVTPVTRGVRRSLVAWGIGDKPFR